MSLATNHLEVKTMFRREKKCEHQLPISQCEKCYPKFLVSTTVGDVLDADRADGSSKAWADAADKLLEALARDNKFIVSDMVIIFLESADFGLFDYSPLGPVFRRAAKRGIISRIERPTKQALWISKIYRSDMPL